MRLFLIQCSVVCGLAVSAFAQQARTPAAIVAQSREASGGRAWDGVAEIVARGDMMENGFAGKVTICVDARTGRNDFRAEFAAVGATIGSGMDARQAWSLNQDGDIGLHPGANDDADGTTEMYLARHGYWQNDFAGASVTAIAPATEGSVTYERIEITPPRGRKVALWIDEATHLLNREQWGESAKFYSDYRNVNGLMLPFSIQYKTGAHEDYRYELKAVEARPQLEEADFAVPFHHDFTMPASGVSTVPSSDGIAFDVRINGKGPFKVFLDTGSINVITADLAKQLGLMTEGEAGKLGAGNGIVDAVPVKIAKIEIGDVTLHDQPFHMIGIAAGPGEPVAVLGFEFLQRFVVKVDYEHNRLTMYDGARFRYDGAGVEVPLEIKSRNICVNASVDGFKGRFLLDSGNQVALELEAGFVRTNDFIGWSHARFHGYAGRSFAGPLPDAYFARVRKVQIGGAEVEDVATNLSEGAPSDGEPDGNIGRTVLRQFNVTFDVLRGKLYLEKNGNWGPVPFNRAGIVTDPISGGLKVMTVLPGSSGEKAGLAVGDLITLIDGHIPTEDDDENAFTQPVGRVLHLMVRHENAMRTVAVTLQDVL